MTENKFLRWMSAETRTKWWHDSAIPDEIMKGVADGAVGVTTNPVLVAASLAAIPDYWRPRIAKMVPLSMKGAEKAEKILEIVTSEAAAFVEPVFRSSGGAHGYACAQVNPRKPGDAGLMLAMAYRLAKWAPNIAVKLPATAAGLEVLEECAAGGITVVSTVGFTLPQILATAERYQRGLARARKAGTEPGRCYAVVMVGRIDDYIRDVAEDCKSKALESDIIQCGTAIMKRARKIWAERSYESVLMPAGMRGAYHATDLAGADMTLSIHPKIQAMLARVEGPFVERIEEPVEHDVLERLSTIREFRRAYEPDGLGIEEFITYGVVQKTLSQFAESGWAQIEAFAP